MYGVCAPSTRRRRPRPCSTAGARLATKAASLDLSAKVEHCLEYVGLKAKEQAVRTPARPQGALAPGAASLTPCWRRGLLTTARLAWLGVRKVTASCCDGDAKGCAGEAKGCGGEPRVVMRGQGSCSPCGHRRATDQTTSRSVRRSGLRAEQTCRGAHVRSLMEAPDEGHGQRSLSVEHMADNHTQPRWKLSSRAAQHPRRRP